MFVAFPADAQTASPVDRVVFDATVSVLPGGSGAPCMLLEAGRLTIRASLVGDSEPRPTTIGLNGYRGSDPGASMSMALDRQESTVTVPLTGGTLYCWGVNVTAAVSPNAGLAELTNYSQLVAIKMTLAP